MKLGVNLRSPPVDHAAVVGIRKNDSLQLPRQAEADYSLEYLIPRVWFDHFTCVGGHDA